LLALLVVTCAARIAHAQPLPECNGSVANKTPPINTTPGYIVPPQAGPAVQWTEFAVAAADPRAPLLDPPDTIHTLLQPAFDERRMNDEPARTIAIARAVASYGYQLVHVTPAAAASGVRATFELAPLPVVRKVDIDVAQGLIDTPLDEEIRRRMTIKVGSYLPYTPINQQCALLDEAKQIDNYLHDEGYFDATVEFHLFQTEQNGQRMIVEVRLNAEYTQDDSGDNPQVIIEGTGSAGPQVLTPAEIKEIFHHRTYCALKICFGTRRFRRERHAEDIVHVLDEYHKRGYPAARVTTDYDPGDPTPSLDRTRKVVTFSITVDPRRRLDVEFDGPGHEAVSDDDLRAKLTFDKAGSSDDVEAQVSANALTDFLQSRGFFDARVTWTRRRETEFDKITYHLELGHAREVAAVTFTHDDKIETDAQLSQIVTTKAVDFQDTLFGTELPATRAGLDTDVQRLTDAYKHAGYRDARVRVTAATVSDPPVIASAALAAALVSADRGDALYVHFDIDAGPSTVVDRVELAIDADPNNPKTARELCSPLVSVLADATGSPMLRGAPWTANGCTVIGHGALFKDDASQQSTTRLRDFLAAKGHPRATVDYRWEVVAPHHVVLHYDIRHIDSLTLGGVVVRGNFKTRTSIILDELQLKPGQPLTTAALADASRRLRAMGLFDAVDIELPALCIEGDTGCAAARDRVGAVVRVQERYDYFASVQLSGGYSSYSGAFATVGPSLSNILGIGLADVPTVTIGSKIFDVENVLRVPKWLVRRVSPIEFQAEIDAFYREQNTPNFGDVLTRGVTVTLSRTKTYARQPGSDAHVLSFGLHYDYRDRQRNVDVIRAIGVDNDQTQVPVSTITGSFGVVGEWDQRVDRSGGLAQLAPENGFRVNASASVATTLPVIGGQDNFIKVSATATRYVPLGDNIVLRADLRYDQGIPLGDSVLLPEVERFFAGGDNTVRGYNDDLLAKELVQVGVPPVAGGVTQLRVLPAGGNIRVMGSLDAQVRIWKLLASGLFMDAGMITNEWSTVTEDDIRPSVGMALLRVITPFGLGAIEYAVPLRPQLGDDPRGRFHISFAARAQF
jgi:outer membrane protein assembly factor BamA